MAGSTEWIDKRVSTVHTFQGKEEETLLFIMPGLSKNSLNAAKWSPGTLNLLNIAITFVQNRVYTIDYMGRLSLF